MCSEKRFRQERGKTDEQDLSCPAESQSQIPNVRFPTGFNGLYQLNPFVSGWNIGRNQKNDGMCFVFYEESKIILWIRKPDPTFPQHGVEATTYFPICCGISPLRFFCVWVPTAFVFRCSVRTLWWCLEIFTLAAEEPQTQFSFLFFFLA